jgi:hypothetical protein
VKIEEHPNPFGNGTASEVEPLHTVLRMKATYSRQV